MAWVNICDVVYPIGAVYSSYVSTTPATLFGGTWTAITGKFPYYNAGTGTGGSNTHTLTVSEIPSHRHKQQNPRTVTDANQVMVPTTSGTASYDDSSYSWEYTQYTGGGGGHTITCLPIKLCTLGDALLRRVI